MLSNQSRARLCHGEITKVTLLDDLQNHSSFTHIFGRNSHWTSKISQPPHPDSLDGDASGIRFEGGVRGWDVWDISVCSLILASKSCLRDFYGFIYAKEIYVSQHEGVFVAVVSDTNEILMHSCMTVETSEKTLRNSEAIVRFTRGSVVWQKALAGWFIRLHDSFLSLVQPN